MEKNLTSVLAGLALTAVSGCGAICLPGATPKDGMYEVKYQNGETATARVDDGLFFMPGVFSVQPVLGYFSDDDTNLVGDNCYSCHCPRNGSRVSGCFDDSENFRGTARNTSFCRVVESLSFSGSYIGPLEE